MQSAEASSDDKKTSETSPTSSGRGVSMSEEEEGAAAIKEGVKVADGGTDGSNAKVRQRRVGRSDRGTGGGAAWLCSGKGLVRPVGHETLGARALRARSC